MMISESVLTVMVSVSVFTVRCDVRSEAPRWPRQLCRPRRSSREEEGRWGWRGNEHCIWRKHCCRNRHQTGRRVQPGEMPSGIFLLFVLPQCFLSWACLCQSFEFLCYMSVWHCCGRIHSKSFHFWIVDLKTGFLSFGSHWRCISFLQEEQDIKALQIKNRKLGVALDQRQVDTDLYIYVQCYKRSNKWV